MGTLVIHNEGDVGTIFPHRSRRDTIFSTLSVMETHHDVSSQEAVMKLACPHQGSEMVAGFSIIFCSLAGETRWSNGLQSSLFQDALLDPINKPLAMLEHPASFDAVYHGHSH